MLTNKIFNASALHFYIYTSLLESIAKFDSKQMYIY